MISACPALGSASCIAIEGADARRFAQAQFSGDVDALAPGHWQWNAWLTDQGRVRALMHLVDPGNGTLLAVLRGGDADAIRTALARYLLRMRATLTVCTFTAFTGGPAPAGSAIVDAHGVVALGYGTRSLRLASDHVPPDPSALSAWRLADIRQGWPTLPPGKPEFLPPALGLEHLGAVAFDKGCYPGQEIAARLHYRGGHKYRLYHLRSAGTPPDGPVPDAAGKAAFRVLDAVTDLEGSEALAVVSQNYNIQINILENIYHVVSMFEM